MVLTFAIVIELATHLSFNLYLVLNFVIPEEESWILNGRDLAYTWWTL